MAGWADRLRGCFSTGCNECTYNNMGKCRIHEDILSYLKEVIPYYNGKHIVVFDTETTGLTKNDYIVQFSAAKFRFQNGIMEKESMFCRYINPPVSMPEKASKVNGLTDGFLCQQETEDEIYPEIREFLIGEGLFTTLFAAYNNAFDEKMLYYMAERQGDQLIMDTTRAKKKRGDSEGKKLYFDSFDILQLAKILIAGNEVPNYKLQSVAGYFGLGMGVKFHDASADVDVSAKVLQKLFHRMKNMRFVPVKVISVKPWKGPNHNLKRIYIDGEKGESFFYDQYKKTWAMKTKNQPFLYDPDDIVRQCTALLGISKEEFFVM